MTDIEPSREALVHRIAAELDRPSLYMGGPSLSSRRKAERIVDLLPNYQGAIDDNEKLRLQVAALENDGMELAAKLGEVEEQIARLTASGRQ